MQITSRHNPKLRRAQSLRNRGPRVAEQATLVDGVREVIRAATAGARVEQLFVCAELLAPAERDELDQLARGQHAEWLELDRELFARLAYGDRYDGAIAVVATSGRTLAELAIGPQPLIVVVEGVEKPGNLGAILRTADGVGAAAVLVADPVIDLFNPNTIRASVSTVFHPRVAQCTALEAREWLVARGLPIYAARPNAEVVYSQASFANGGAIVLGSEAEGLTDVWQHASVTPIRLPMRGIADSLNVSVTAAVLMYEALRQTTNT